MKLFVDPGLPTHWKLSRFAELLGVCRMKALGYLVAFWLWVLTVRENGSLDGIKADEIAIGSTWSGEGRKFLDALIGAVLVDENPLAVHGWLERQGSLLQKREAARLRQQRRRNRLKGGTPKKRKCHANVTRDKCDKTRQGEGEAKVRSGSVEVPSELRELPLYAADRSLCRRLPGLLPSWRSAFPGVDVPAEIRKAHSWEQSNPSRRKKDRVRFLHAWLSRAQDKPLNGRTNGSNGSTTSIGRFALPAGHFDAQVGRR